MKSINSIMKQIRPKVRKVYCNQAHWGWGCDNAPFAFKDKKIALQYAKAYIISGELGRFADELVAKYEVVSDQGAY